jgi:hypothetical protein
MPVSTYSALILDFPVSLDLMLDVYPLAGLVHEFPIQVKLNEPVREIEFIVEHPFYAMTPTVLFNDEWVISGTAEIASSTEIAIKIMDTAALPVSPDSPIDLLSITFSGIETDYLQALQFDSGHVGPPAPPVRHSPPLYPVWLRNISYVTGDGERKTDDDVLETFYLYVWPFPVKVKSDLTATGECEEHAVRLYQVNDLPIRPLDALTTELDENGEGEMQVRFSVVSEGEYGYYQPTEFRFQRLCNGRVTHLSDPVRVEDLQGVEIDLHFIPVSGFGYYSLYD